MSFVSTSSGGACETPSNNIGKSDGNSSNRVNNTALSCSCAYKINIPNSYPRKHLLLNEEHIQIMSKYTQVI